MHGSHVYIMNLTFTYNLTTAPWGKGDINKQSQFRNVIQNLNLLHIGIEKKTSIYGILHYATG